MTLQVNDKVGDSALTLLLDQFKNKDGFVGLIRALVEALRIFSPEFGLSLFGMSYWGGVRKVSLGLQEVENVFGDFITKFALDSATGDQLKFWAKVVGCPGGYSSDDEYRRAIYLQIAINVSQGDTERLIDITQRLSGAVFVHYIQKQPSVALFYSHMLTTWSQLSRVERAAQGGVRVVETGCPDANVFVFGADRDASGNPHGAELPYGSGFGEYLFGNAGGELAEVYA